MSHSWSGVYGVWIGLPAYLWWSQPHLSPGVRARLPVPQGNCSGRKTLRFTNNLYVSDNLCAGIQLTLCQCFCRWCQVGWTGSNRSENCRIRHSPALVSITCFPCSWCSLVWSISNWKCCCENYGGKNIRPFVHWVTMRKKYVDRRTARSYNLCWFTALYNSLGDTI